MRSPKQRRHLSHYEVLGRACHATWRLHHSQPPLRPGERQVVCDLLRRATEFGCTWYAAVVMDDHVHTLFRPGDERSSRGLVSSWKGASARLITKSSPRTAPIWQAEYYLRWLNGPDAIARCATYIRANPARRWPGIESYPWIL